MPSSYTTSLRLTLPATGELAGQWGATVNTGITELLDAAVAGTTVISTWGGAGVPYTLSNNSGTADEARKMFIVATGTPGEAKNVICPAVSKLYVFRNDTTGGFALTLKTSGGTGIAVPAGQYKMLYCDGTNVVEAVNSPGPVASLSASQAVFTDGSKNLVSNAVTGTGNVVMSASPTLTGTVAGASLQLSSLTSGRVTYAGASGLLQDSTNLTFDGTSLTLGGNPTLSAGTANGVLYLNGSKVATSGSALTFNGSSTLTFAGGSASYLIGPTGEMLIGEDGSGLYIGNGAGGLPAIPILFGSSATTFQRWFAGGSEQMRLTSTGLGIGTSSPVVKLDVNGALNLAIGNNLTWGGAYGAGTPTIAGSTPGGGTLLFYPAGSTSGESMRLDSSGNLGLGVTPSAWRSTYKAIQVSTSTSLVSAVGGGYTFLVENAYFDSSDTPRYLISSSTPASYYRQDSGAHRWYTAPSGTAGNAISFTQAMTLDASGNLGVGETSPATYGKITLKGGKFSLVTDTASERRVSFWSTANGNSENAYIQVQNDGATTNTGEILLATKNSGGTLAERARIDASGRFAVGGNPDTGCMITAVATASRTGVFGAANTDGFSGVTGANSSNSATGYAGYFSNSGSGTGLYISNTAAWQSTSDERLKTDIKNLNTTARLMQIQARDYLWKSQATSDNPIRRNFGFIAQEVREVFPELVGEAPDGMLSVEYTGFIAPLVKAIQEQQAIIEDLRARVAALEAQP